MAKILSQDEIDALLSNISGDTEIESSSESLQKVSMYDFRHPNLVSKEQFRLLETIHEGFCRSFGVSLSAQMRMIVEMNLLAVDQILYSEFVMSIAPPSCIYVSDIDIPPAQIVIEISPQLAIFVVERLFGGRGSFVTSIRPISAIEQKIMKRVIDRISSEISKSWQSLAKFECSVNRFESNSEFVQTVPSSEPVVVVSMEIKIQGNSTLMNICYPYIWISSILSSPEVQERLLFGSRESSPEEKFLVEQNLKFTKTQLKALLGKSTISIGDFLNLKEGDIIRLDTRTDQLVSVFVRNRHMYDASVGMHRKKYTCKVQTVLSAEEKYEKR